jgi:hypothetical protein
MLLRLLRGRRGRPGRVGQTRSEPGASQAGASQAGASEAGANRAGTSQAGRPGSHRKTKPSAAASWPSIRARSGLSVAPRDPGRSAGTGAAGPGATRAGAHRAGATAAGGSTPSGTASSSAVPGSAVPGSTVSNSSVSASTGSGSTAARAAIRVAPDAASAGLAQQAQRTAAPKSAAVSDGQPWYATAASNGVDLGLRDCGALERVLIREWDADASPSPETVAAINRLAGLPKLIKEKLATGLDAIHVGDGGVPDLDQMGDLKGVPLPSGRSTWDACAGAYGDRKIIVGSRPSPTPDVTCHEVGHALDDLDGAAGLWQSDLADFTALYDRCLPHLAIDFHRRDGAFSRREFFADSFAAIASAQRPALVEMLSGNTRSALDVMLYFNVRYGI